MAYIFSGAFTETMVLSMTLFVDFGTSGRPGAVKVNLFDRLQISKQNYGISHMGVKLIG